MRRLLWLTALVAAIELSSPLGQAWAQPRVLSPGRVTVGLFGGANVPVAQDDGDIGPAFGVRGRVGVLPFLAVESSVTLLRNGGGRTPAGGTIPGADFTSISISALLRAPRLGLRPYLAAGAGWSSIDVPGGFETGSKIAWSTGVGVELGVGPVDVDVSSRFFLTQLDSGASRKNLGLVAGLGYSFH